MMPRYRAPARDSRLPRIAVWLDGALITDSGAPDACALPVDLIELHTATGRDSWRDPVGVGTVSLSVSIDGPDHLSRWKRGSTLAAIAVDRDSAAGSGSPFEPGRWLGVWQLTDMQSQPVRPGERWRLSVSGTDLLGKLAHTPIADAQWPSESQLTRISRLCRLVGIYPPQMGTSMWPWRDQGRTLAAITDGLAGSSVLDQLRACTVAGTVCASLSGARLPPLGADLDPEWQNGWAAVSLRVMPTNQRPIDAAAALDGCAIESGASWSLDYTSGVTSVTVPYGPVGAGTDRAAAVVSSTVADGRDYPTSAWSVDSLLDAAPDALDAAQALLAAVELPRWRVSNLTADLAALTPAGQDALLLAAQLPFGAVVLSGVQAVAPPETNPDGSARWADGIALLVESVSHDISWSGHKVTLGLSAPDETSAPWRYGLPGDYGAVDPAVTYSGATAWQFAALTYRALRGQPPALADSLETQTP